MKNKKVILFLLAFTVIVASTFMSWEPVKALTKSITIKRNLVENQTLIIPSGRGGVYFYEPAYTGTAVIIRTEPGDTKHLSFTRPWLTIELYDTKGNAIITAKGLTYVFYNLTEEERNAWDNGMLKVFQFNVDKQIWQKCETQYLVEMLGKSNGRVMCQISRTYRTYGLALRK